jgi:sodium-dependent dicarboxylate transporter 2/3/5
MNTQMIICMVIFAATLISYMLNKIPMWLTAMISMAALTRPVPCRAFLM